MMLDRIEMLIPDGGPAGLGFIRGTKAVDPSEWFYSTSIKIRLYLVHLVSNHFFQLIKVTAPFIQLEMHS